MIPELLTSARVRLQRRFADLDIDENRRAREDREVLTQRISTLAAWPTEAPKIARRFRDDYLDYLNRVGHPNHAASLELIATLWLMAEALQPKRMVDLGSGFTSFIFRTWAAEHPGVEVWSVDDSPEWLERTRAWLGEKRVSTENLAVWETFIQAPPAPFDLVLHDMGMMDTRARTLNQAISLARKGGYVILDDVHKDEYRRYATGELERANIQALSLKAFTRDPIFRYAWLALPTL